MRLSKKEQKLMGDNILMLVKLFNDDMQSAKKNDTAQYLKLEYAVGFIGRLISRMSPVAFVSKEFLTNDDIKLYESVIDRLVNHNEKYKKDDFAISKESIKYLPMNTKIFFQATNKKVKS